jgi:hypothetical protein
VKPRLLLALLVVPLALLVGCFEVQTSIAGAEGCANNGSPQIDNLELNSWQDAASGLWVMCVHFDWLDPGSGSSPPNMIGGYVSTEIRGFRAESIWFDDEVVSDPAATLGQINIVYCHEDWEADTFIDFEMRVRDSCGAVSNEKSGEYCLGQGICDYSVPPRPHVLEHPEIGGDGCQVQIPCPEPEEPPTGA